MPRHRCALCKKTSDSKAGREEKLAFFEIPYNKIDRLE